MSLLGKILLAVNLLAAIGLTYLSAQNWAKRQEVNGLGVRYQLTLAGIPVEAPKGITAGDGDVAIGLQTAPGHVVGTVSKKLLDTHFGGSAPKTQLDEVQEVKRKIENSVASQADDATKLRMLCGGYNNANPPVFEPGLLMKFADNFEERQAIRALGLTRNPQQITANLAEARKRVDRKFEALMAAPSPNAAQADAQKLTDLQGRIAAGDQQAAAELTALYAEGAPAYTRDQDDRRNRIAQMLMLHDTSSANQKRTILVVGLRTYALALNEQLARMEEIVRRTERQIEQDQAKFQEEYELLKRLAVEQDQLLFQQQRVLAGYKDQLTEDEKHVEVRQTQLTSLETDLKSVADTVANLLQAQQRVEQSLFDVQKKVGETLTRNFELEQKLLLAEQGK